MFNFRGAKTRSPRKNCRYAHVSPDAGAAVRRFPVHEADVRQHRYRM